MIGRIKIAGESFRQIDRLLGRIPALDKALQKQMPGVRAEIGQVVSARARAMAPKATGELAGGVGYRVCGDSLHVGVWGVRHAYPTELGVNTRMIVKKHRRLQSVVFGRRQDPVRVNVRQFVRQTKTRRQPFMFKAYFDSFRAMFGIMNRAIGEAQKEVGLGDR